MTSMLSKAISSIEKQIEMKRTSGMNSHQVDAMNCLQEIMTIVSQTHVIPQKAMFKLIEVKSILTGDHDGL